VCEGGQVEVEGIRNRVRSRNRHRIQSHIPFVVEFGIEVKVMAVVELDAEVGVDFEVVEVEVDGFDDHAKTELA